MCLPLLDTPRFFLKTNLQIISKISADLICSNYFGNKSEFRPRFKGTDYIRAKFTFDFFMKKPQIDFQTKNARKKIRYHSSRTMITWKQAGGCYPPLRVRNRKNSCIILRIVFIICIRNAVGHRCAAWIKQYLTFKRKKHNSELRITNSALN